MEARAQLLEYREWFRTQENRRQLASVIGMEIYEPALTVIIGRASEFRDSLDRQKLKASLPYLELVTYDDIVKFAKRRRLQIDDPRGPV
jgi:hypothetical protein